MASFVRPDQSPLAEQDSQLAPKEAKKKERKKEKKVGHIKATSAGLEGLIDWVVPISYELAEKMEDDMSSLAAGFFGRMLKRAASGQGEITLGFEVPGDKHPKLSGPDEEA